MASNILSCLQSLAISSEVIPLDRLVHILSGVQISQVSRSKQPKTLIYPGSLTSYVKSVDNLHKLETIILALFRDGDCTIKDWWKILVIIHLMIKNYPILELEIAALLLKIICSGFVFKSF